MDGEELGGFRLIDIPPDEVGDWVTEKHEVLKYYVKICRAVRRRFSSFSESTYIDLYSASGLSMIKTSGDVVPGSPLVAALAAKESGAPFDRIFVADADSMRARACARRLQELQFNAMAFPGPSEQTVQEITAELNPRGFHFAFLDPYSIELPHRVIQRLAEFRHIDMLVHVSEMDIERNLDSELASPGTKRLECFAPGWRKNVDPRQPRREMVRQFLAYWAELIQSLGLNRPPEIHRIKNSRNRRIYHLALLSQNDDLAAKFWKHAVKADSNQTELF